MQRKPATMNKLFGMGALIALLSACSANPNPSTYSASTPSGTAPATAVVQNVELNAFLTTAPANGSLYLADSRWGGGIDIIVEQRYFAASGRQCRKALLMAPEQIDRSVLLCEVSQGNWAEVRPVTELLSTP